MDLVVQGGNIFRETGNTDCKQRHKNLLSAEWHLNRGIIAVTHTRNRRRQHLLLTRALQDKVRLPEARLRSRQLQEKVSPAVRMRFPISPRTTLGAFDYSRSWPQ